MANAMTILLAGGGTGGHLYPGISVAEALRRVLPEAHPLFLCTQRPIDRTILAPTGFEFIEQPIVPPVRSITGLLRFFRSWRETRELVRNVLRERAPAAVLGLGGYAAGVAVKAAADKGIPAAILNPDVIPGKANQYLMRHVQAVCCQFETTRERLSSANRAKMQLTGCPIRQDIVTGASRDEAVARLGLAPNLSTLVVTGASQGAQTINEAVLSALPSLRMQGWQILHLSGKEHVDSVRAGYRHHEIPSIVVDFTPAMADVWAVADLAIARSGASTCAELTACAVPSILMPYPFHKDMHQRANAKVLADAGAAVLLDDHKDARANAGALVLAMEPLLHDSVRRRAMSDAARSLARPDAADAVASVITQLIRLGR